MLSVMVFKNGSFISHCICRTEPGSKFVGGFSKFGGNAISTLLVFNFFSIFSLKKIKQCKIYLLDCMFLLYSSCM